jgi:sensor histidine kinase regulating citrate/malate metabolism
VLVPTALFDSVADNLLQNALLKRQSEGELRIEIALTADASVLSVCDSGSAIREEVLADLLRAPLASENGLGIGLYHAARQAEELRPRIAPGLQRARQGVLRVAQSGSERRPGA